VTHHGEKIAENNEKPISNSVLSLYMPKKQSPVRDNTGAERASIQPKQSQKRKSAKLANVASKAPLAGRTKFDRKNSGPPPDFEKWFLGLQENMAETLHHLHKAGDLDLVKLHLLVNLPPCDQQLQAIEKQLRLMPADVNRETGLKLVEEGYATLRQLGRFVGTLVDWEGCCRAWHWST
jgi:hypothetical protein